MKFKRFFSIALSLIISVSFCSVNILADESTTQGKTAYKDLSDNTEIYAVTQAASWDYPYYGAKWEPNGGVYYGRTTNDTKNIDALKNESIVSQYYGTNDQYGIEHWSYIYGSLLEDGNHGLLVYMNFDNEGNDCDTITAGTLDTRLISDFKYLNTLSCPVFLRIGGEVNVWSIPATPEKFISAYQHIADLAHTYAPNVALIFSPNYSSSYKLDMDNFYPGDAYVDWIGCSLYYNRYHHSLTNQDEFLGVGVYGDPMLNVQQTINLANLHQKPVIITEGGSSNKYSDNDNSQWAAERMQKAYSFLPMVYPQIKAMVASDYGVEWESTDYTFYNNPVVNEAYNNAVNNNPTLIHSYNDKGAYYTKLSSYETVWSGIIKLAAYTYSNEKLAAHWYIDGVWVSVSNDYPYSYTIDTSTLSSGSHTIEVRFSNGATKTYSFNLN